MGFLRRLKIWFACMTQANAVDGPTAELMAVKEKVLPLMLYLEWPSQLIKLCGAEKCSTESSHLA
jgi:hypothetical protein